jgi:predicted permease
MTAPIAVRDVAAAAGALLVLSTVVSVVGTVIVPRKSGSRLTRLVASVVSRIFELIVWPVASYRWRDRIMAGQAAVILLGQLAVWLGSFYVGYALLIWPATRSIGTAFTSVGPALWTFGSPDTHGFFETAILDTAAMAGLITVTLQIAYLPALYAAFNRRENEITLLNSRAGSPSWGPELLARTHYALGSGTSALDTLPDFYNEWERWAADITESHVTYLPLVWFRSPSYEASWVTSLLAVLDSAALYLSLCPQAAPAVPARLCLRSGLLCFSEVARSMGIKVPAEPAADAVISLTYAEFLDAVGRLREVNFPIERQPQAAWPHFVGWRVNYEQAAYAIAAAIDAVPALWSGPRRHPVEPMPPLRPRPGRTVSLAPSGPR